MMVLVSFPDGVREVPAFLSRDVFSIERASMRVLEPEPIDGWRFERVIGNPEWIAFEESR
jgi:hypothetical protein